MYRFKHIFLESYPDTVPFSEIIEPSGYWRVLVMAHNKPLYEFYLDNSKGTPEFAGMGSLRADGRRIWDLLLRVYPESTGINPVLFSRLGTPIIPEDEILYSKQENPRKIRYLKCGLPRDPSLEALDDSEKLIRHWKKQGINEVGISGDEYKRRRALEAGMELKNEKL